MAPGPPWRLRGEGVVALARPEPGGGLPTGARPFPGPSLLVAATYVTSPVGPYQELAVARPVHLGYRLGLCVTTMAVDSTDSRSGGRRNWGFPKELATLQWRKTSGGPSLRWEEQSIQVSSRPSGPSLAVVVPLCCIQQRSDSPVMVLGALKGRLHPASIEIDMPAGSHLEGFAGRHRGFHLAGLSLIIGRGRPLRTK